MSQSDLLQRIHRLERSVRLFRFGALCGGLLLAVAILAGAVDNPWRAVEANLLAIPDEQGNIRILISAVDGIPSLVMTDNNGAKRLRLTISDDQPQLLLYDAQESLRSQIRGTATGAELAMFDAKETRKLRLRSGFEEPQLTVYGSEGKPRAQLFVLDDPTNNQGTGLHFMSADGESQLLLANLPNGETVVRPVVAGKESTRGQKRQ
jgi:hypothetical protein